MKYNRINILESLIHKYRLYICNAIIKSRTHTQIHFYERTKEIESE